jgi:hypothetical protein
MPPLNYQTQQKNFLIVLSDNLPYSFEVQSTFI